MTSSSFSADNNVLNAPNNNNNDMDRLLFYPNIDYLYERSSTNEMHFNTAKCEVIAFYNRGSLPTSYKIGDHLLNPLNEIK